MKKIFRWLVLFLITGLFLAAFYWDVRQSFSTVEHKVIETLLTMVFFGFCWIWSGFNEVSSYQEMVNQDMQTDLQSEYLINQYFSSIQSKADKLEIFDKEQFNNHNQNSSRENSTTERQVC